MSFQPSVRVLVKILQTLKNNKSIGKTELAELIKTNHSRVTKNIDWLERKEMIKSIIEENKIHLILTDLGNDFLETME